MILHRLDGCAPTPLAHYLKALGILRLVGEQLDPEARGWWEGERFLLASHNDQVELLAFFLFRYEPTPLVSPWNKGSGFFYENDLGLTPLESSTAQRFGRLREGVKAARQQLDSLATADHRVREIKAEAKDKGLARAQREALRKSEGYRKRLAEAEKVFKQLKADLIPGLRLSWRGPHREWMDAAMVLGDDGDPRYPALLGTGGNDGRLDFTNNYLQRLADLFELSDVQGAPRSSAAVWFKQALFGHAARALSPGFAVGQFAPGGAGGANASNGPEGGSYINPVDVVLMLEGSVLFTAAATRRLDAGQAARAAAPFALPGQAAGYASAGDSDESARGEQWMPLWSQPLTLSELRHVLAEGRAQLGARSAAGPLDLARAVARLGTARGIEAFQRYAYIERNGQSNLAVPLGRFAVADHVSPRLACLDDLDVDAWLSRLRREARAKGAPARLVRVERRLADALFSLVRHPEESERWRSVLLGLADVEAVQVTGSGYRAGPIPRLRPEWVAASDDNTPAFRLALSFALQAGLIHPARGAHDGVRRHWLPLEGRRFAVSGSGAQGRLMTQPQVVMVGRSGLDDAIAVVERRLVEAAQRGERRLPLQAARDARAAPGDLARFLAGEVDADTTLALARGLMAVHLIAWQRNPCPPRTAAVGELPDDAWLALRLALLPWPLPGRAQIGTDPAIVRRLESGDAATAVALALRRLRAAGIASTVRASSLPPDVARRWAAALAFPISRATAVRFAARLDPNTLEETVA